MNKYAEYERLKAEIARTAKTPQEYEKKVKELARKMKIQIAFFSKIIYNNCVGSMSELSQELNIVNKSLAGESADTLTLQGFSFTRSERV